MSAGLLWGFKCMFPLIGFENYQYDCLSTHYALTASTCYCSLADCANGKRFREFGHW